MGFVLIVGLTFSGSLGAICWLSGILSCLTHRITEVWKGVRTLLVQQSQRARRGRTSCVFSIDQAASGPTKRKLQSGMLGRM